MERWNLQKQENEKHHRINQEQLKRFSKRKIKSIEVKWPLWLKVVWGVILLAVFVGVSIISYLSTLDNGSLESLLK